jgi:hypothetical protein
LPEDRQWDRWGTRGIKICRAARTESAVRELLRQPLDSHAVSEAPARGEERRGMSFGVAGHPEAARGTAAELHAIVRRSRAVVRQPSRNSIEARTRRSPHVPNSSRCWRQATPRKPPNAGNRKSNPTRSFSNFCSDARRRIPAKRPNSRSAANNKM